MKRAGALRRTLALLHRATVLAGLIARAAGLYLHAALARRALARIDAGRFLTRQERLASDFVRAAMRYRGGLIKLGQVASLRIDVLPETVTDRLAGLQDRVASHPFEEIDGQLSHELGADWRRRFASFETEPIASASLGQVHRARSVEGAPLAVKVLYPHIEASVAVDLAMARVALWLFDFVAAPDLAQVHRQLRDALHGEMDYEREGRCAERIGANLAKDAELAAHTRTPRIHWEHTRRRVLCMEFIEGDKVNDREALAARGVDGEQVVLWATRAFLHMMLRDGDFHCDPHPGNLLVDREGRVAILDFGMNMQLAPGTLAGIRDHVVALVQRDPVAFAASMVRLQMIDEARAPAVEALARIAFDPAYFNLTAQEVSRIDFLEYFGHVREHMRTIRGFRIPDGLVMWGRAWSLLFGLASELAPGLRPLDLLGPYAFDFLGARTATPHEAADTVDAAPGA